MAKEFNTLVELYERSIRNYANNPLFGVKKNGRYEWITYRDFDAQVAAFRAALAQLGVGKGDVVAIIANNSVDWAVAAYATYCRAASFCPMYESQLLKEWEYIVRDSGTKVLLVSTQEIYDKVKSLTKSVDSLERVLFFEGDETHEDSVATHMEEGRKHPVENEHPKPDDLAGFIYTSGTTGNPKGVLLSHKNTTFNVGAVTELELLRADDVSLAFLPWAHVFGQNCELHVMFSIGASMGLVEDVTTIIANLSEVRPTALFAVPRIFNRIYDALAKKMEQEPPLKQKLFAAAMANSERLRELEERNQSSIAVNLKDAFFDKLVFSKVRERFGGRMRFAISGGAALNPEVARFIDNLHINVYEGYGLSETSPLVSVNIPGARKIGSVGQTIPGVDVVIRDVEGYEPGIGEVCVLGDCVMQGYHNQPEKTEEVIEMLDDGRRLFHTGDLGRKDEDNFIWILGRVKEQYKLANGKYVVPSPIEETFSLSPYILQTMIEGANHTNNMAVVVIDKDAVSTWASEHGVPASELLTHQKVIDLIKSEIDRVGSDLKSYERPKDVILDDVEWTPENDMLTPKMSLKRRMVMEKFGPRLEDLHKRYESQAKD